MRDLDDWTSQLRRGVLELCILRLLEREPTYGYHLVTALAPLRPLAATENTIYPLLRRLKVDRVVETFFRDSPSGPPRSYYRLTATGARRLSTLTKEWASMVDAVDTCLGKGALA